MGSKSMVARGIVLSDEEYSLTDGDLGLGFGLKPGGIPRDDFDFGGFPFANPKGFPCKACSDSHETDQDVSLTQSGCDHCKINSTKNECCINEGDICKQNKIKRSSRDRTLHRSNSDSSADFRTCSKQRNGTAGNGSSLKGEFFSSERNGFFQDLDYCKLQNKLQFAKEEIENLSVELEACQQQLNSKYGAVKILQRQRQREQDQQQKVVNTALSTSRRLQQEVNMLQWQLELKQSYMMDSEQTWAEKFDRVACENAALMAALQARSEELRKLSIEKMTLSRERDELTAAKEVMEKIKNDNLSPDRDALLSNTDLVIELATLGACECRGLQQEPCQCARAAVTARRHIARLDNEVETLKREKEEALLASDSYRVAYEEQLSQNTSLLFELLEKSGWLRRKLGWCVRNSKKVSEQPSPENCLSLDEEVLLRQLQTHKDEQVQRLVHMLSEKCEALTHQKLATKMLAIKTRELEEKVQGVLRNAVEDGEEVKPSTVEV